MQTKNDIIFLKRYFILAQALVLIIAMASVFWILARGHKDIGMEVLKSKLEASGSAMAGQLKANQVPLASGGVGEKGTFIISSADGAMVIDRHDDNEADQKLWQAYRTKLIYEMQKQKNGWITYPDKTAWGFNQKQKIIRYISVEELGWILALEVDKPTELQLFLQTAQPSAYSLIIIIMLISIAALAVMTIKYFEMIKKQISSNLEDNFMNLSGEDKVWQKPVVVPVVSSAPVVSKPVVDPVTVHMDEREAFFVQKPTVEEKPVKKTFIEEKPVVSKPVADEPKVDSLTINVSSIKSPVLKKMLKEFRER